MKQLIKAIIEIFGVFLVFVVGLGLLYENFSLFGDFWWTTLWYYGLGQSMIILLFIVFFMLAFITVRTSYKNDVLQAQLDQFNLPTKKATTRI